MGLVKIRETTHQLSLASKISSGHRTYSNNYIVDAWLQNTYNNSYHSSGLPHGPALLTEYIAMAIHAIGAVVYLADLLATEHTAMATIVVVYLRDFLVTKHTAMATAAVALSSRTSRTSWPQNIQQWLLQQ